MILSKTNVAPLATLTDSPASTTQDINVITDGDYSSVYTTAMSPNFNNFYFAFSVPQTIGYLAIAGNVSQKNNIQIRANISGTTTTVVNNNLSYNDSQVMVFKLDLTNVSAVEVTIFGTGNLALIEIAMGEYYTVPNGGEQSGYKRPWTIPNRETRTAKSLNASPVATLYQGRSIKSRLTIPNKLMANYSDYYDFLDFATTSTFYILEDDDPLHSCAGFNIKPLETKAHGSTRLLGVSGFNFDAYSKGMIL